MELKESAKELLLKKGYDATMGARPMRRTIQNLIEDPVSEKIISSEVKPGDFIEVTGENDEIHFNIKRFTAAAVKA
jgi:ATP-dependent Clp protease ATP-binding subunit ClpA